MYTSDKRKEVFFMDMNLILNTNMSKTNFLKGLIRIAKSDGVLDEREISFYNQVAVSMGLTNEEKMTIKDAWQTDTKITLKFDNSEQKIFFFIQAIQLCWMDESYTERERLEIRKLAEELGVSENAIIKIEDWALEGIQWNKKADNLLALR